MEGNGPIQGTPKHSGVLEAGGDPVAVDATCCRIMGIDPMKVRYLQLAARRGKETEISEDYIRQVGESIQTVSTPFELIPQFQRLRLENS
jgi:uncharacterized protein (DUF362 family)